MIEKVNPCHPDKVADRIAGAVVDLAYKAEENPKIAVEVLIGHGVCHIIAETSAAIDKCEVCRAVHRIRIDTHNDAVAVVDKLFVNTASNLNYGGYGEASEFKPTSKDTPVIYLGGRKKTYEARL